MQIPRRFTTKPELRTTLKDIAKQAGVSATTVSLALQGHPRISAQTRERIVRLAERMGYRPDPVLLGLNRYRHRRRAEESATTLAWVNAWPSPYQMYENANFRDYRDGAWAKAQETGYRMEEFWLDGQDLGWARLCDILRHRGIRGVLLPPVAEHGATLSADWRELSVVSIGRSICSPQFDCVSGSQSEAARLAMVHLIQKGFRRVGFYFHRPGNFRTDYRFLSGYLVENFKFGLRTRIPPLICESFIEEYHRSEFMAWVRRHRPEVILTLNSLVVDWLQQEGYRIPEDCSVVHLALPVAPCGVVFSGVDQRSYAVGAKAVQMLADLVARHETGVPENPSQTITDCRWVDGATLAQLPLPSIRGKEYTEKA